MAATLSMRVGAARPRDAQGGAFRTKSCWRASGKYAENIPNYEVKPLLDCKERDLQDDSKGLILVATVGKINQKDKESGDRRVFQTGFDNADNSL
jgi:hypothetical protein